MTDQLSEEEVNVETDVESEGEKSVPVQEFQESAGSAKTVTSSGEINLDALMDVQVNLSVEIGRSKLAIKDLIQLSPGSVVELDRMVEEPLDLMVNGTLIARGEVVVVDGQFGLRLIDVVSPAERLKKLK